MSDQADRMKTETLWKREGLSTSLQEVFRSSDFSDVKIVSNNQEFKVHKVILSTQSGYFSRLFKRDWIETREGVIRLEEDDLSAIQAMLHFMYGFQYDSSDLTQEDESPMLLHVKAYQIGDKYDVQRLKEEARAKFVRSVNVSWESDNFPIAIAEVYSTTPPEDRDLRDPLVDVSIRHLQSLRDKLPFKNVVRETVGFAADIILDSSSAVVSTRYESQDNTFTRPRVAFLGGMNRQYYYNVVLRGPERREYSG